MPDTVTRLALISTAAWFIRFVFVLLLFCQASSSKAKNRTNDPVLQEAIVDVLSSLPPTAREELVLRSQVEVRYARRANPWTSCFVPIGFLPLSFNISVECLASVTATWGEVSEAFVAKADLRNIVWGRAPNPMRPVEDVDYQALENNVRRQVAKILAKRIAGWLKNETKLPHSYGAIPHYYAPGFHSPACLL